jgi:hypothetical protein
LSSVLSVVKALALAALACAPDSQGKPSSQIDHAATRKASARDVRSVTNRRSDGVAQQRPKYGVPEANRLALLDSLIGIDSTPSARRVEFEGGAFARYERDFRAADEKQWKECGPRWDCINYYDRAAIYYAWWRHTGDKKYLERANAVAVDYRTNYLEANNYGASFHWAMMDGVAMHYLATGDTMSLIAVGKIGDNFAYHGNKLGGKEGMDNRIQARYLVAVMLALKLHAPSTGIGGSIGIPGGNDWPKKLRDGLTRILSTQEPTGAWKFGRCNGTPPFFTTHPFTVGLLLDALTRYSNLFEQDPRILPAVRRGVDYLWEHDWLRGPRAFKYVEEVCPGEGGPSPAADLNNLLVNGYAWVYHETGDMEYRQRADEIFAGSVNAGAAGGDAKHFNQQYSSSIRYLTYRFTPPKRRAAGEVPGSAR